MVCLDSDILIALLNGDKDAVSKVNNFESLNVPLKTTYPNLCELFKGAYKSSRAEEGVAAVERMTKSIRVVGFSTNSCKTFGFLVNDMRKKGQSIGEMDIMIASLVLSKGEVLVTRNVKHFSRIPNLKIEKW